MNHASGEVDARVGARVKAARLAAKVSQAKLGESLGLTFQQVQKYEKGSSRLNVAALQRIAETLGIPASHFLDPEHRGAAAPEPQPSVADLVDPEIAKALSLLQNHELRQSLLAIAKLVGSPDHAPPERERTLSRANSRGSNLRVARSPRF